MSEKKTSSKEPATSIAITEQEANRRLDNLLLGKLKGIPRTKIYSIIRRGEVRVNSRRCEAGYRLCCGDVVRLPPLRSGEAPKTTIYYGLMKQVVYENQDVLILNKPSGIAVHGGSGLQGGAVESLRTQRKDLDYLELAHRLDRDTSGCLLFAKKPLILRVLHAAFRERKVDKAYLALVQGIYPTELTEIKQPLQRSRLRGGERVAKVDKRGKESLTRVQILGHIRHRKHDFSLLRVSPNTGRTHQIRVHLASNGYPIAGDGRYGSKEGLKMARELGLRRLFLHAQYLKVPALRLEVKAALPEELSRLIGDRLGNLI